MTLRDREGQPTATKRTPYVLGVLLITCIIAAAVVVPVVLLTRQPTSTSTSASTSTSSSNGEILLALEPHDEMAERILDSLTNPYSSAPPSLSDDIVLVDGAVPSSNATMSLSVNSTTHNSTATISGLNTPATPVPITTSLPEVPLSPPPSNAPSPGPTPFPTLIPTGPRTTQIPITTPPTPSPTPMPPTPSPAPQVQIATIVQTFNILETIPHDSMAFTQGLTFDPMDSDVVYESTGIYGRSDVRKVNIQTGQVLLETDSPSTVFGEGLAYYPSIVGDYESAGRLIHITWQNQQGFIFDSDSLQLLEEFQFSTARNEGWGITYNPNTDQFLVTDGSEFLHFWDRNRNEVKRIPVTLQTLESSQPEFVTNLNEIEWDNKTGTVLANIWQTDNIVRIDPTTGAVVKVYDMSQLFPDRPWSADVLNGIAISPENDLWVTGKLWPSMFRIEFVEIVQY